MAAHACWQVTTQCGTSALRVALLPEAGLRAQGDGADTVWQSYGDHAGFRMNMDLPAGWYWLDGRIECLDGEVTLPSLRIVHDLDAGEECVEIPLPEPDRKARVRLLVLFKFPVSSLTFCPSVWASRFRLHGFRLQRLSRKAALYHMLTHGRGGTLRRTTAFVGAICKRGRTTATDEAFASYRRSWRPPGLDEYAIWIRKYDTFTDARMRMLHRRLQALEQRPMPISLVLPVHNTTCNTLRRCIDAVSEQMWPYWNLCAVTNGTCDEAMRKWLQNAASTEPRIRLAHADTCSLAETFNKALDMADSDYVAVLAASDQLRRHALLEIVDVLQTHVETRFMYADDDCMDSRGQRSNPRFKPDWNPDLLYSRNYIGGFAVIGAVEVREAGGFRDNYGGPFHDLFLRCTERMQRSCIRHVPQVLLHRDADPAARPDAPSNATDSGVSAVAEHFTRRGIAANVEAIPGCGFRVHWPLPTPQPKTSIIIPTRDRLELLQSCVDSILTHTTWSNCEIVVVDNQSEQSATHAYLNELRRRDNVRVVRYDAPFNYSAINNYAVAQCDGDLVCLMNNDIEIITDDWLQEMASHALRPEVGAVGAMLYYPNDTVQHAGVIVGLHGVADHVYAGQPRGCEGRDGRALVVQQMSAVTAACLLVRRETYLEVGGLDETLTVAFNDVDFCLRLRESGYCNIWTPYAEFYHHESATRGRDVSRAAKARYAGEIELMRTRWAPWLHADPAYNPNLSLTGFCPGLAFPPRMTMQ